MISERKVTIHYRRFRGDYRGWGIHVWGENGEITNWDGPLEPSGWDDYGVFWELSILDGLRYIEFIVHRGEEKDPGPDQRVNLQGGGNEFWIVEGDVQKYSDKHSAQEAFLKKAVGNFTTTARAHWLTREIFVWPNEVGPHGEYKLICHPSGGIRLAGDELVGRKNFELEVESYGLDQELLKRFPHLKHALVLRLNPLDSNELQDLVCGQIVLTARESGGKLRQATGIQIQGILDDLFTYPGPLGVSIESGTPIIRVWAPTAKKVDLIKFADLDPTTSGETIPMTYDPAIGVWEVSGDASWIWQYYLFSVEVYTPRTRSMQTNLVTDPYSYSLALNSKRTQIVDLQAPALLPEGWSVLEKPPLTEVTDAVLYELHVRDFSARDESVGLDRRGKYAAFQETNSSGINHLRRLAAAGLTHIHLLPIADNASYDEDPVNWQRPDYGALAALPPDSDQQQEILDEVRGQDGYNWGYDPFHFMTPEGSYASDPDGPARILETREMVAAINRLGFRVVLDVAFNHTFAAGQEPSSVLDKIVPGYYHRLDANGEIARSTCCPNTATEFSMMEKLMRDAIHHWARIYKVDGFRFDLMGHHLRSHILTVRADLDSMTLADDGLDGTKILLYGEGWDFGELAGNARGLNASQQNMAGTGIGTFNDRIRDAGRGGGPFTGLRTQGFISGLAVDPNESEQGAGEYQRSHLLYLKDLIRLSLAGNLKSYQFISAKGGLVQGKDLPYRGTSAGYTEAPQENILYLAAHDNETLFDAIQYKASRHATIADRVRMQCLGISLLALAQGLPFFHAGVEILRSKSLDRDSYRSGDWFNYLDYSYKTNNWGIGLPFADINHANWGVMRKLLNNPELFPEQRHILQALDHFEEMVKIRKSSPLFRFTTAEAVRSALNFYNTGPNQELGLLVMSLVNYAGQRPDNQNEMIFVLINTDPAEVEYRLDNFDLGDLRLHPVQMESADPVVRNSVYNKNNQRFLIPGRTTAVYVRRKS